MPEELKNGILKRLPEKELEIFMKLAELVHMDPRDTVIEPYKPVEVVHFPEIGLHSMVSICDNEEVEVATVGFEGMIGIPLVLGEQATAVRVFCQMTGSSWEIKSQAFLEMLDTCPVFRRLCTRYCFFVLEQAGQNSACNRIHSINERCAKWLLLSHDRAFGDQFDLTQEFLAQMLGVRRQSVNLAAGTLQSAGLVKYTRGIVTVLNRAGLEDASCECYTIIKTSLVKFLTT
ncbi:MAG TPA: Crp/Fnr family transcriptional regulator [Drouetiella sp.]